MNKLRIIILLVGGMFLTSCGSYFAPDRNVKEVINASDIIGTWTLTSDSTKLLTRDGFRADSSKKYRIVLLPDGKVDFDSVIEFMGAIKPVAKEGTWKLDHGTKGNSSNETKNILRISIMDEGQPHGIELYFAREQGSLLLWDYHGDPDSWEFMEYTRSP